MASMTKAEHFVPPPIGSTFTTVQHSTGSFGSGDVQLQFTRGERMWEGRQVITFTSLRGTLVIAPDGAWLAILGAGDKPVMRWDPPINLDWPLVVGKTWISSYRVIDAADRSIPVISTWKIEAYEDVSVPAGTYKAFKVVYSDTTGTKDTSWFSFELGIWVMQSIKRAASSPMGAGTQEAEVVSQTIRK
jgi:hypothetical protein